MPFFLMKCTHHENADAIREAARPQHRQWVDAGGNGLVCVLLGSAIAGKGSESEGRFGILEAPTEETAWQFSEGDAFNTSGAVANIEITRLVDKFQVHRVAEPFGLPHRSVECP